MLKIESVINQDRLLRALTGLNKRAFESLLPIFEPHYQQSLQSESRKRAVGGVRAVNIRGKPTDYALRKAQLETITAKLFFILFYFKCYPTFDLAGFILGIHRSQTHYWVHKLQPVLEKALGVKMVLPERKLNSIEEFIERYPTVKKVIIDGTERPISRPKDREAPKTKLFGEEKTSRQETYCSSRRKKEGTDFEQSQRGKSTRQTRS